MLSAILLQPPTLDEIPFLEAKHFYADANARIFQSALDLRDTGRPIDIVSVAGYLRDRERLQQVGGSPYLAQLSDATPAVAHVEDHAKTIVGKWELRQIIHAAQTIVAEGYGDVGDPEEWKQAIDQRIFSVTRSAGRDERLTILSDATREAMETIGKSGRERISGVRTGLPTLDLRLGGLQPSRVYVIAARPGIGKTACATGIALACAKPPQPNNPDSIGDGVVFISVEMPKEQIAHRVLSQVSRIDSAKISRGNLNKEEWDRLAAAQKKILRMPIVIEDSSNHSPSSIRAAMRMGRRKLEDRFGKSLKVKLGAIDYLQLLSSQNSDNREQEISAVSRAVKSIAKDEGVAMLSLAQVNRECEKRKPPIPQLHDLRESGSLEQDADVVIFLYREDYYRTKGEARDNKAQIIVAKWRDGSTGTLYCEFEPTTTTFHEASGSADYNQLGDIFDDNHIPEPPPDDADDDWHNRYDR